jgi:16S rRNA (adenine1518-N6/adenine1519-N6)-dimethyltransferase
MNEARKGAPDRENRRGRDRSPDRGGRRRKALGQHFLVNRAACDRIVDLLRIEPGDPILEIGPGRGALTRGLLDHGAIVRAIEIDPALAAELESDLSAARGFQLIRGDARRLDLEPLLADLHRVRPDRRVRVVGNLPYHSATAILQRFLPAAAGLRDLHFMLQAEVADRIAADPGGPEFGYLSVLCQVYCRPRIRMRLGPGHFRPPPRVHSAFLELLPLPAPFRSAAAAKRFRRLLQIAFCSRRKTLWNNLRRGTELEPERLRQWIGAAAAPEARPQELSPQAFLQLFRRTPKTVVL